MVAAAFSLCLLLSFAPPPASAQTPEQLAAQEFLSQLEPQRMVFDIYVGGQFRGNALVVYTDEWVDVLTPADAVEMIPDVRSTSPFIPLFSERLFAGEKRTIDKVGAITALPRQFRLNVEVDPRHLVLQRLGGRDGPEGVPLNRFTMRHGMRLTASTDFRADTDDRVTLSNDSFLSNGNVRLHSRGNLVKKQGYDIRDLALSRDEDDVTLSMGMLETNGIDFAYSRNIYGVTIETNQKKISAVGDANATEIQVFVPERGRVEVLRGEELLFSRILDFGLQELDTSRFPSGSYEITIRVPQTDGSIDEEIRRFVKTQTLVSADRPHFNFSAGLIRDNVDATETPILQFGRTWRSSDHTEMSADFYTTDEISLFQPKLSGMWERLRMETSLNISTENDIAFLGSFNYKGDGWYASLNGTQTISGFDRRHDPLDPGDFGQALPPNGTSIGGSTGFNAGKFTYKILGNYNDYDSPNRRLKSYSFGPNVTWRAISTPEHLLKTELKYLRTHDGVKAQAFANYRWRPKGDWTLDSRMTRARDDSTDTNILRTQLRYNNRELESTGTEVTLTNNLRNEDGGFSDAADIEVISVGSHLKTRLTGLYTVDSKGEPDTRSAAIEAETNLLQTQSNEIDLAGEVRGDAAVLVEVNGNATGNKMIVLVNGQSRAHVDVGSQVALQLQPYKTYEISLRASEEADLLNFDTESFTVTPYPGNMLKKRWHVDKMVLVMGRLVDIDGAPLGWQRIKGMSTFASTDGSGNFQLELSGREVPYVSSSSANCTAALPPLATDNYFLHVGDIVCL